MCLRNEPDGVTFGGVKVWQLPDFGFKTSMDEYIQNKVSPVRVEGTLQGKRELSDAEMTRVKGGVGSINWAAGGGRPDLAAASSIIPAGYKHRLPSLVSDVNVAIKQARDHKVSIRIWPIPVKDCRFFVFTDSSCNVGAENRNQNGFIAGCTNQFFNNGQKSPLQHLVLV